MPILTFSQEVSNARNQAKPIVALESTIIAHGMPYPENVATARAVEQVVRKYGATPATIAVVEGKIKIGLTDQELESFGKAGSNIIKVSRKDLGVIMAQRKSGACTVAATMHLAAMANLSIFATGGIGGVHRGAMHTGDISADMTELSRTPVAVVSAGAKAILDLPRTLEYLETMSVPVIGYKTDHFPAFYWRSSGLTLAHRIDEVALLAETLSQHWAVGGAGVLIANPIPQIHEAEYAGTKAAIQEALDEAKAQNITGKALTPFLLSRIAELTQGESLKANIQLVLNNAQLAAQIAVSLADKPAHKIL